MLFRSVKGIKKRRKKEIKLLKKKVADLEKRVQDQPLEIIRAVYGIRNELMAKSGRSRYQKT